MDDDDLLVNWMRELLYEYETSGYMLKEFDIQEAGEFAVRVEARGEKFDPDRHEEREAIGAVAERVSHLGKMGLPVDRPGEFRAVTANGTPMRDEYSGCSLIADPIHRYIPFTRSPRTPARSRKRT